MKIYHTETQEDFNDLISKLYKEGYSFQDGTPLNFWSLYGSKTGVEFKKFKVSKFSKKEKRIYLHNIEYYAMLNYVGVEEILEYKVGLDAKVKFKRSINMKIYHTETQEDYDALMVELEEQGCKWASGDKPSEINWWRVSEHLTCVDVCDSKITYASLSYYKEDCPDVPIIKYKAKADDKMKLTKESVLQKVEEWFDKPRTTQKELRDSIKELEDTSEKVAVPKCFDEWFKEIVLEYPITDSSKRFALWKLSQQGFGHGFEDVRGKEISYETELGGWLLKNKELAIDAVLNGYTVEPDTVTEQRYTVVIADRYLVQLFMGRTDYRFVEFDELWTWEPDAFQLTEAEIKAIDERYWTFAVPAKEEEE